MGTHDSLIEASTFVQTELEKRGASKLPVWRRLLAQRRLDDDGFETRRQSA